jgi:hypothetical protein
MNCTNCQCDLPAATRFCPNCGQKVAEESLESMRFAIEGLQAKINLLINETAGKEQKYLEKETIDNIAETVMKWAKRLTYFIAIPLAVLGTILVVLTGKSLNDLRSVAFNARATIEPMIAKATSDAEEAKKNADIAHQQSEAVEGQVKQTSALLESLKNKTRSSSDKLNALDAAIQRRNTDVAIVEAKSSIQSKKIQHLKDQISAASYNKNEHHITDVYPVLAGVQRVQAADRQVLDVNDKAKDETYVSLNVSLTGRAHPITGTDQITRALGALTGWKYRTFFGDIALLPDSSNAHSGPTATIEGQFCDAHNIPIPCIVYFDQSKGSSAYQAARRLDNVWDFDKNHIRYVDSKSLSTELQQLIQKSGLDLLVIFGH